MPPLSAALRVLNCPELVERVFCEAYGHAGDCKIMEMGVASQVTDAMTVSRVFYEEGRALFYRHIWLDISEMDITGRALKNVLIDHPKFISLVKRVTIQDLTKMAICRNTTKEQMGQIIGVLHCLLRLLPHLPKLRVQQWALPFISGLDGEYKHDFSKLRSLHIGYSVPKHVEAALAAAPNLRYLTLEGHDNSTPSPTHFKGLERLSITFAILTPSRQTLCISSSDLDTVERLELRHLMTACCPPAKRARELKELSINYWPSAEHLPGPETFDGLLCLPSTVRKLSLEIMMEASTESKPMATLVGVIKGSRLQSLVVSFLITEPFALLRSFSKFSLAVEFVVRDKGINLVARSPFFQQLWGADSDIISQIVTDLCIKRGLFTKQQMDYLNSL